MIHPIYNIPNIIEKKVSYTNETIIISKALYNYM